MSAVFTWEGPVGGKAKSVAQPNVAQLTLFDVTFEKNLNRSEPGEIKPTEDLFPVQTTLHAFLKMPKVARVGCGTLVRQTVVRVTTLY